MATTETFNSSTTWVCPAGVTTVQVECIGGGGGGKPGAAGVGSGGGGGGGYTIKTSQAVTPGQSYTINVGTGGASGVPGGDTYFIDNTTVLAKGGNSGSASTAGGSNSNVVNGVGDTKYAGGTGGNSTGLTLGGGGGGAAGSSGAGGNGTAASGGGAGGTGTSPGGNGGNCGGGAGVAGNNGTAPGGAGGGGGSSSASGGSGADGRVILTYTVGNPGTPRMGVGMGVGLGL